MINDKYWFGDILRGCDTESGGSGLLLGMDELGLKNGLIVTEEFEGKEVFSGKKVRFVLLWKWVFWAV